MAKVRSAQSGNRGNLSPPALLPARCPATGGLTTRTSRDQAISLCPETHPSSSAGKPHRPPKAFGRLSAAGREKGEKGRGGR
eukprot:scaffold57452_cov28-Tisochrysis_lutea.AAC.2